uniref:Uncharacterized protein n=1 Tax=Arundo donax TaxID=35708 RepID=A0A0A9C6A2_ARUDO
MFASLGCGNSRLQQQKQSYYSMISLSSFTTCS